MSTYTGVDFDRYCDRTERVTTTVETVLGAAGRAEIRRDGDIRTVTFPDFADSDAPSGRFTEYEDAFSYAALVVDAATTTHAHDAEYIEDFRQFASLWTADDLVTAYRALGGARTSRGATLPVLDVLDALHIGMAGVALSA